jgi:hypothetical protein
VAALFQRAPQLLHRRFVIRVGRANPAIIFYAEFFKRSLELIDDFVDVISYRDAPSLGRALDVDSVFVGSGDEERIDTTRSEIGSGRRLRSWIRSPMCTAISVVDRCCYVRSFPMEPRFVIRDQICELTLLFTYHGSRFRPYLHGISYQRHVSARVRWSANSPRSALVTAFERVFIPRISMQMLGFDDEHFASRNATLIKQTAISVARRSWI